MRLCRRRGHAGFAGPRSPPHDLYAAGRERGNHRPALLRAQFGQIIRQADRQRRAIRLMRWTTHRQPQAPVHRRQFRLQKRFERIDPWRRGARLVFFLAAGAPPVRDLDCSPGAIVR